MTRNEIIEIAGNFVKLGVKKIRLTGGEPLVRHDAKEIMEGLAKLPVSLAVSTNGLLADRFIETFKKCGVRSVNVSLDTLKSERFSGITRRNYFDTTLANIGLLLKENFHLKLNAVLMKGVNDDEIGDFVEFTRDKNLHYRFIEFMPFNGNRWDWSRGVSFKEIMEQLEQRYAGRIQKLEDKKHDTAKAYKIKGYQGTFAIISSVTNPFCDSCNRLRLTADGKMKNCLFSGNETDLLGTLRQGKDITPLILESILNKKAVRAGMDDFTDFADPKHNQQNRSMITIGG